MTTVLFAFGFMLLMVALMAVGVVFGRKPIAGSCGGMKALGMEMECEICGGDPQQCDSDSAGIDRLVTRRGR
ncbi:MAG: hypothetical protein CMQ22_02225 [Gammaproteobacteria bacterium]|nr:hypothetical protein [Gammaproteobacteria bacterium]|tara:strand:- start:227 stop:442 length:216 start_codon:yes stop_codon:yes gene_type:complete